MNFKSVDNLLGQDVKKKYIYNDMVDALPQGYDDKVLSYDMNRSVDVGENLTLDLIKTEPFILIHINSSMR